MYPKRPSPSTEKEVFPAFPRISPHFPALPLVGRPFGEKTTFFFANAKVPPRVFKIFTARRFTPPFSCKFSFPFSCKFSFPAPLTAGREKSTTPRPNRPSPPSARKGGRKKEKKRRAGQKQNGKGEEKKVRQGLCGGGRCALASVKNGEKQQRRPQRFWGRLCRKKPVAADGKPTERSAIKDRFYKKSLRQVRILQAEPYGRQGSVRGIGRSGPKRRLQRVKACGRSKKARNDVSDFFYADGRMQTLANAAFKRIAPRQRISLPRP